MTLDSRGSLKGRDIGISEGRLGPGSADYIASTVPDPDKDRRQVPPAKDDPMAVYHL